MTNKLERLPDDVRAQLAAAYESVKAQKRIVWNNPDFLAMWKIWHTWKLGERQNMHCGSCGRHVFSKVGWMLERLNEKA